MKVEIDIRKSIEENAAAYFDRAKKIRKKKEGILKILESAKGKLSIEEKPKEEIKEQKKLERKWFEKFRWFYSSDGFLCLGGRDATSNEIVIKKHTNPTDIIFHTDMAGSPFFVIQSEGKPISKETIEEVANATASYSKAWKLGLSVLDVFYVNPTQVTKAKAGEYLSKGAFMIYGKKNFFSAIVGLAIGRLKESELLMCAPKEAVLSRCDPPYFLIAQGDDRPSAAAKKLNKYYNTELDSIIRLLPAGNIRLTKI